MTLVKWNGNGNANPIFSNLLENFFGKDVNDFVGRDFTTSVPAVNIAQTPEAFKVEVAAPGLKKEHFQITLDNQVLTISSNIEQKNEAEEGKYSRKEFSYRSFKRSFTLPKTVDTERIEAKYTDGVLYINLPKREESKEKPSRQIEIS